ncbi:MAG: hypothetical protein EXS05_00760 [Planctomycetaceae bacterium]|nr:hypothetical protein [Planctomycetaceae bacterium]
MRRFILIDPPLVSTVGHHHEFAHNVLRAAAEIGFEGVLAGHRQCQVTWCGGWPVRAQYRDGLWTHQAGNPGLRLLSYAVSALRRVGPRGEPLQAVFEQGRDRWRARRFAADTQRLLEELSVTTDDLVFVPNATWTEVVGVTRLLRAFPAARRASWHLEFHFNVFPRSAPHRPEDWRATRSLQKGLRGLRSAAADSRLFLYTDTDELTLQYNALQAGAFFTLPIPVDRVYRCLPAVDRVSTTPLKLAYVGDARGEKGYPQLPEMIRRIWSELVATGRVQFSIQSNCRASRSEQAALSARNALKALPEPQVRLLTEPLGTDEYRQLVLDSDVLLLPYDPAAYEARSSGILSEALAAGKPVIVPDGTWMARQLASAIRHSRSVRTALSPSATPAPSATPVTIQGLVAIEPRSSIGVIYPDGPAGMADAVREIAAHFEHYQSTATAFASRWSQRHSPARLVSLLQEHSLIASPHFVLRPQAASGT